MNLFSLFFVCRPAFLEEYERYEDELNQMYDSYVVKFRCYAYLQQQLQQILNFNQVSKVFANLGKNFIRSIK